MYGLDGYEGQRYEVDQDICEISCVGVSDG
jgi:hypothetical protein